jgi:hypothetical protein
VQATKEIAIRGQGIPFGDAFRLGEAIRRLARDAAKKDIQEGLAAYRERVESRGSSSTCPRT